MIFYYKWFRFLPALFYCFIILFLGYLILPVFFTSHDEVTESYELPAEIAEALPVFTPGFADPVLAVYEASRESAVLFFSEITGSEELASLILEHSAEFGVAPSLAFSLCWEESRFNAKAVNSANRDRTVDRGLFQLNSSSFPGLTEEDFFDPLINSYYGIAHLKYCLDAAGTEVAGLAMYNAGANRVKTDGTPKMTLDYISRIMKTQRQIEKRFMEECFIDEYPVNEEIIFSASVQREPGFFLSLLSPLGKF